MFRFQRLPLNIQGSCAQWRPSFFLYLPHEFFIYLFLLVLGNMDAYKKRHTPTTTWSRENKVVELSHAERNKKNSILQAISQATEGDKLKNTRWNQAETTYPWPVRSEEESICLSDALTSNKTENHQEEAFGAQRSHLFSSSILHKSRKVYHIKTLLQWVKVKDKASSCFNLLGFFSTIDRICMRGSLFLLGLVS